ncbi:MAG: hypothetical protein FJZ90_14615 [Chloroflexi bacterium]|nr:hypothetical protein [Chloroflexota bacterium]
MHVWPCITSGGSSDTVASSGSGVGERVGVGVGLGSGVTVKVAVAVAVGVESSAVGNGVVGDGMGAGKQPVMRTRPSSAANEPTRQWLAVLRTVLALLRRPGPGQARGPAPTVLLSLMW